MRYFPVHKLTSEHVLGQNIYDENFNVVVPMGTEISDKVIERIKKHHYYSVYIESDIVTAGKFCVGNDQLHEWYKKLIPVYFAFKNTLSLHQQSQNLQLSIQEKQMLEEAVSSLEKLADEVILYLQKTHKLPVMICESKSLLNYEVQHPLHTGIISIKIGLSKGLNMNGLRNVFIGAILNDVGYFLYRDEKLKKIGLLSLDDKIQQQQHANLTYQVLNQIVNVNNVVKRICYEHHERENGSGYPRALLGHQINPLSKVLIAAITFDAMISDRPYRPGYAHHKALTEIKKGMGTLFESSIIEAIEAITLPFPVGSIVTIDGEHAIVSDAESGHDLELTFKSSEKRKMQDLAYTFIGLSFIDDIYQ